MLELTFRKIFQELSGIINLHLTDDRDPQMTSKNWESVFKDFDGWTILSVRGSAKNNNWGNFSLRPLLCPISKTNELKENIPDSIPTLSSVAYDHVSNGKNQWIESSQSDENIEDSYIQIFFRREHYGRPKGKENYIEFNQMITHPLGLHWSESKQSLCTVNELGEEVEKVRVISDEEIEIVVIRTKLLDFLLHLGKWDLVRSLYFTRWKTQHPQWKSVETEVYVPVNYTGRFRIRMCTDTKLNYIDFQGAHIRTAEPLNGKELSYKFAMEEDTEQYGSFIVHDLKNGQVLRGYSLKPENFANYFTDSDKPFEMSPIFFKAEVLDKYKNNPDKYALEERQISCRGGWHLQTYDVNDQNQVHTYAVYLRMLPFNEQLHWQTYNEEPKSTISNQAFKTDFMGEFSDEQSKMSELKSALKILAAIQIPNYGFIWAPKGGSLEAASKGLHLVRTENGNQWHDFVIALTNTVNEGFKTDVLKKIATAIGNTDNELRTLGLIKYILQKKNPGLIPTTHSILNELQVLRGRGKAHGTWSTPEGSLIEDSSNRLENVYKAVLQLGDFFKNLTI